MTISDKDTASDIKSQRNSLKKRPPSSSQRNLPVRIAGVTIPSTQSSQVTPVSSHLHKVVRSDSSSQLKKQSPVDQPLKSASVSAESDQSEQSDIINSTDSDEEAKKEAAEANKKRNKSLVVAVVKPTSKAATDSKSKGSSLGPIKRSDT